MPSFAFVPLNRLFGLVRHSKRYDQAAGKSGEGRKNSSSKMKFWLFSVNPKAGFGDIIYFSTISTPFSVSSKEKFDEGVA